MYYHFPSFYSASIHSSTYLTSPSLLPHPFSLFFSPFYPLQNVIPSLLLAPLPVSLSMSVLINGLQAYKQNMYRISVGRRGTIFLQFPPFRIVLVFLTYFTWRISDCGLLSIYFVFFSQLYFYSIQSHMCRCQVAVLKNVEDLYVWRESNISWCFSLRLCPAFFRFYFFFSYIFIFEFRLFWVEEIMRCTFSRKKLYILPDRKEDLWM